jgi:hypothetical protein
MIIIIITTTKSHHHQHHHYYHHHYNYHYYYTLESLTPRYVHLVKMQMIKNGFVVVVYTPDPREQITATASFLGRLSSSLPVLVPFTFSRN